MSASRYDIAIIGGGVMGCAAAYFLQVAGVGRTCVIEPDPTYAKASTPVATGGCRRLFSRPENILMSQFSIAFFKDFAKHMAVDGSAPDAQWKERGYLFVVGAGHEGILEDNHRTQESLGVKVELMDRAHIAARYPWMRSDDVALGVLSPEDGWLDPNTVLQGFRKQARAMGADFVQDRVVELRVDGKRVTELELASGKLVRCEAVVNAAGCWAASIA